MKSVIRNLTRKARSVKSVIQRFINRVKPSVKTVKSVIRIYILRLVSLSSRVRFLGLKLSLSGKKYLVYADHGLHGYHGRAGQ